jgi:hypothetical protein
MLMPQHRRARFNQDPRYVLLIGLLLLALVGILIIVSNSP